MSDDWDTSGWPAADDEDAIRRREIEEMMRSERERYFRDEAIQQEYRDIVDRQIAAQQPASKAVAKPATSPEAYYEALARFRATGTFFADVDDARAPLGKGEAAATSGFRSRGTIPAEHKHQQFASTVIPSGITLQDDSAGDKPERFSRQAMSHDLAKGYSVDLSQLNKRQAGLGHKPQRVRVAQNDAATKQPVASKDNPSSFIPSVTISDPPHRWDGVQRVKELQGNAEYRPYAIKRTLKDQINYAAQKNGLGVEVHSGGQARLGQPGKRYPNKATRHDDGDAADVKLFEFVDGTKRYLNGDNLADRKRMASVIEEATLVGITGVGYGYMGPQTIHLGGGDEAVWSAMKKTGNPPKLPPPVPWVDEAVQRGRAARRSIIKSGAWPNVVGPAVPGVTTDEAKRPADAYLLNRAKMRAGNLAPPQARLEDTGPPPATVEDTRHQNSIVNPADAYDASTWSNSRSWSNEDERLSLIRRMLDNYLQWIGSTK